LALTMPGPGPRRKAPRAPETAAAVP
jgi:hypothetical protein